MPGKDRQAIEQPFAHAVGLRQLKDNSTRVYLAHGYRFSANNQEIALRSMHVFVEVETESEKHVIRVQGLPVRELQSMPQYKCVRETVRRDFPGLCQRRFR